MEMVSIDEQQALPMLLVLQDPFYHAYWFEYCFTSFVTCYRLIKPVDIVKFIVFLCVCVCCNSNFREEI